MESTSELRRDLEELEVFLKAAKRPTVIRILKENCDRLRDQVQQIELLSCSVAPEGSCAEVFNAIDRFAWDQTPDFIKLYVQLDGVEGLPAESTSVRFEEQSVELLVRNLNKINYSFKARPLYALIDPSRSSWSVKKGTISLRLAKRRKGDHWDSVIKHPLPKAIPKPDPSADPSDSIMNMMKNLYNQGDSEMKRTIAKAWTESQERKMKGFSHDGMF